MHEINISEIEEEVSKLNSMDENGLYAILGYQSLGLEDNPSDLQLSVKFSINKSELITNGEAYFEKYKQRLKEKICYDWKYCKKRKEVGDDIKSLSTVLVPILVAGLNLPAALIAVLFTLAFKYGLDNLCECEP